MHIGTEARMGKWQNGGEFLRHMQITDNG